MSTSTVDSYVLLLFQRFLVAAFTVMKKLCNTRNSRCAHAGLFSNFTIGYFFVEQLHHFPARRKFAQFFQCAKVTQKLRHDYFVVYVCQYSGQAFQFWSFPCRHMDYHIRFVES